MKTFHFKPNLFLIIIIFGCAQLAAQNILPPKRILIQNPNQNDIHQLLHLGVDMECGSVFVGENLQIEIEGYLLEELNKLHLNYTVLVEDLRKFYSERAKLDLPHARSELLEMKKLGVTTKNFNANQLLNHIQGNDNCEEIDWTVPQNFRLNPNNSPNSFGGCLTHDQVLEDLDKMRELYPHLISERLDASPSQQKTIDGNTVYYVRISDNPDVDEEEEQETLYQALIHSRESASVMQQLFFMWYLLENYETDPSIKNLLNNQALYFIPIYNPDGFIYNQVSDPDGGGFQRKNRNLVNSCGIYSDGVDLNRNSAYYWGNGGSSTEPCSQIFMGNCPFSEIETQIMRDFFLNHDFKLSLNHHSFKNAMLHAYAGTTIPNPRAAEYAQYNHDMTFYNRYAYGPSTSISSLNSGNMNDWMLGGPAGISSNGTPTGEGSGKHTMAWTPENGTGSEGGFWPSPFLFVPISKRAMRMNLLAAFYSGKYAKLIDLNFLGVDDINYTMNFAIQALGQTDSQYKLELIPLTANILSAPFELDINDLSILEYENVAVDIQLDPSIAALDTISFELSLYNDHQTDNLITSKIIHQVFQKEKLEHNLMEAEDDSNWMREGVWYETDGAFASSFGLSTTQNAEYDNNDFKALSLSKEFDFSSYQEIVIQYYAKWELERSFDYVQLEASSNGINWEPLCGSMMKPGAPDENNTYSGKDNFDSMFQPDGQPLYDGDTEGQWRCERIVINEERNSTFKDFTNATLRFAFHTDGSNRQDSYDNMNFTGFTLGEFVIYQSGNTMVNIEDDEKLNFDIFPNPVTDILHIVSEQKIDQLELYNSAGVKVLNRMTYEDEISMADLPKGLYFIHITLEGSVTVQRIVKY